MFKWVKKLFSKNPVPKTRNEVMVNGQCGMVGTPKPPEYWHALAEQIKMEQRANEYIVKEEKKANRLDDDTVHSWRENNRAVDEYFKRSNELRRKRSQKLRIVC